MFYFSATKVKDKGRNKLFFRSENVMLNEAVRYIAGESTIDLADVYFLPPTGQLNEERDA